MIFKKVKKQALYVWWILLSLATLLLSSIIFLFLRPFSLVFIILMIILFSTFIYFFVYYFPKKIKIFGYHFEENFILVRSGVYWKKTTTVFIDNIQYLTNNATLLERLFKISSVIIRSAGGGRMVLYGLDPKEADKITALIFNWQKKHLGGE